jgi:ATP-dependent Lon protease
MSLETLSQKVRAQFGHLAIDKRRLPLSQLTKRGIPAYVAEWVLESVVPGQGLLSQVEAEKVQNWAQRIIPTPSEQNVIQHRILHGEAVKVLTPMSVSVDLSRKNGLSEFAVLPLLGIKEAMISSSVAKEHKALLQQGMWGVVEVGKLEEGPAVLSFKPMQASVNLEMFKAARDVFSLAEWRALLLISMGYEPNAFTEWQQTLLLARLLPVVQKNTHLMELAPKGTGKSYIYENISTKVRLVSGGNVSPAVLFVNNATGQWGLLARFGVVVLDEVQTLKFSQPEEIVGGLKGYLANGKISRGGLSETSSDCGLVLLANITLDELQRPINEVVVKELPEFLQETAFLDRMRGLIPGWELPKLSGRALIGAQSQEAVGLKSDFFGDALIALREDLSADQYTMKHVQLTGKNTYRRNEESVRTLASGLMKLQFPHGVVSAADFELYCLAPAVRLRQGVWDQLHLLDGEYRQYDQFINTAPLEPADKADEFEPLPF